MLSVTTAAALRAAGLDWSPSVGDRFVIAERDMDADVFVLSDMTIEAYDYPTGRILGFNGTTEWALDSVAVEQALWLPREEQLREALGGRCVGLRHDGDLYAVGVGADGDHAEWTRARDVEEAYALAVLSRSPHDARTLMAVASEGFTGRVHAVPDSVWDQPTPLPGWDVRTVVNHVAGELAWVPPLLAGATLEDVGDRFDGDLLGDDPAAAWDRICDGALRAWYSTRSSDAGVHTSQGRLPAAEYAEQILLEVTVHAWDLARGAGLDEQLDEVCVRHVLDHARPQVDRWRDAGVFGGAVRTESQDPQDQLLALLGRDSSTISST